MENLKNIRLLSTIAGDIIGSKYEFNNIHTKEFELFDNDMYFTDDTVLTVATMDALLEIDKLIPYMFSKDGIKNSLNDMTEIFSRKYYEYGNKYNSPKYSYGCKFRKWLASADRRPYGSYGNGSVMRIAPIAYYLKYALNGDEYFNELEVQMPLASARCTHNSNEGMLGAVNVTKMIKVLLDGSEKARLRRFASNRYNIPKKLDSMQSFDETCAGTIPFSVACFLEAYSLEDSIRNAISIGGDSDTIAIITASLSEAYYGGDEDINAQVIKYLDYDLLKIIMKFNKMIERC